jgi:hypothetical protein
MLYNVELDGKMISTGDKYRRGHGQKTGQRAIEEEEEIITI